ncbi:hypothetical protein [Roseimaritima ulvae]|uniref:Uncharacterized protein n=1 Tax=Roseimaritima ulvae TaxID=980254 RepID=A0A5B9QLC7_9BACT|nr:hypothetical protein [Roseimaritima ulvae]QEG39744.1 hypothetical protein UC8_17420 [Roseimaritima ulvae]
MVARRNVWVLVAGLGLAVWFGSNEAFAQCSGGGGRGGGPTGSPGALNTSSSYAVDPLLALRYSQNVLLAQQLQKQHYQRQRLAAQSQLASVRFAVAEQQRQEVEQREDMALSYRLARAEAKRAARAQRTAERLAALQDQESSPGVALAFVNTD